MPEKLPNFIFGAIYRTKSGLQDASATAAQFNCYTPASREIPSDAFVADCWVCDSLGRIDPASMFRRFRSERRISGKSSTQFNTAWASDMTNSSRESPVFAPLNSITPCI